jgi:hypothetical protein
MSFAEYAAPQVRRAGPAGPLYHNGVSNPFEFGGSFGPQAHQGGGLGPADADSHKRREQPFSFFRAVDPAPFAAPAPARGIGVRSTQEARAVLSSAYRQKRKGSGRSLRCYLATFVLCAAGLWAAFMLRQLLLVSGPSQEQPGGGAPAAAPPPPPSLLPGASPPAPLVAAPLTVPVPQPPALGDARTGGAAAPAADATAARLPPTGGVEAQEEAVRGARSALDDAYALQRLQAGVDDAADAGDWDTGGIGGDAAKEAVRAALLRDHEAALARDAAAHDEGSGGRGGGSVDHSTAHHHESHDGGGSGVHA